MDWISITTGCFALSNAITKTTHSLTGFVRDVRESRTEFAAISSELFSLDGVLDLLKDDARYFPTDLASQTPAVLEQCTVVVNELEGCISTINNSELSKQDKKVRWAATRRHLAKLNTTLIGYKTTLGLALDLVAAGSTLNPNGELQTIPEEDDEIVVSPEVKIAASKVVTEMVEVMAKLREEFQKNGVDFKLQSYFDTLQAFADASELHTEAELEKAASCDGSASSINDSPDSAIDMNEPSSPMSSKFDASTAPTSPISPVSSVAPTFPEAEDRVSKHTTQTIEEIDDFLDQLKDIPQRPPTPPPRDMKRLSSIRTASVAPFERPVSFAPSESVYGITTEISTDSRPPSRAGAVGRIFGHMRSALSDATLSRDALSMDTTLRPTSPSPTTRPTTPKLAVNLYRRSSERVCKTMKKLPGWHSDSASVSVVEIEPNEVFGVSLEKSIQVANTTIRTHHNGNGSSKRIFPLCVFRCCAYIKAEAVQAPGIFGEPGDTERLQDLKDVFSMGPGYGEDIKWAEYSPYEAADLVMLYLSQLPKPLVPISVAKRWITLSKQASLPGIHAVRMDECIDFWEESLGGMRGHSRSLFKLLLNVWADIADNADVNDMTAERLAGKILRPLMQLPARTYDTDYMLGLAFLIRKRSEYTMILQGAKGKSKAAF